MISVYKYIIPIQDIAVISMPEGAQPIHVDNQREQLCLWAIVDTNVPKVGVKFRVAGTGHDLGLNWKPLGSALFANGELVFHLFTDGKGLA